MVIITATGVPNLREEAGRGKCPYLCCLNRKTGNGRYNGFMDRHTLGREEMEKKYGEVESGSTTLVILLPTSMHYLRALRGFTAGTDERRVPPPL